tara:strand:- start:224 stop:406 length:183 start_codon:yes stop_codon:yes gene_type:complete
MAKLSKKDKKDKDRKKQLLIAQNKLRNLKGSKGQIKVGGSMEKTLERLGISASDLLKIKA